MFHVTGQVSCSLYLSYFSIQCMGWMPEAEHTGLHPLSLYVLELQALLGCCRV